MATAVLYVAFAAAVGAAFQLRVGLGTQRRRSVVREPQHRFSSRKSGLSLARSGLTLFHEVLQLDTDSVEPTSGSAWADKIISTYSVGICVSD